MWNMRSFLAKGRMGFGKFLICSSLSVISTPSLAQNWHSPAFESWADPRTGAGIVYNVYKWFSTSLTDEDKRKHQRVVLFALNNLDPGQTAVWDNESSDSEGRATIAVRYVANGTTCCRVYSHVRVKDNQRSYSDTACLDSNQRTWTFVDKY